MTKDQAVKLGEQRYYCRENHSTEVVLITLAGTDSPNQTSQGIRYEGRYLRYLSFRVTSLGFLY